ncbi:MAG TPA: hypothetical protein VHL58_17525 [Thermoanaerobaculia bacterium]|nr:hypothetical protein [Thermoanaerobaculia bacterium]
MNPSQINGTSLNPAVYLLLAAAVQWIAGAVIFFEIIRSRKPWSRLWNWRFIASSGVFLAAWMFCFPPTFLGHTAPAAEASILTGATANVSQGSCALVSAGMRQDKVESKVGKPDREIAEDDIRGPGARIWVYESAQCRIHLLDGVVINVE